MTGTSCAEAAQAKEREDSAEKEGGVAGFGDGSGVGIREVFRRGSKVGYAVRNFVGRLDEFARLAPR